MSRTRKQIGSPSGGACVDPTSFSDPGQQSARPAGYGGNHRSATSAPRTITSGSDSADGNVKTSAKPTVGDPAVPAVRCIQVEPRSVIENFGK